MPLPVMLSFGEIIKWKYEAHGQLIRNVIMFWFGFSLHVSFFLSRYTHRKDRYAAQILKRQMRWRSLNLWKNIYFPVARNKN